MAKKKRPAKKAPAGRKKRRNVKGVRKVRQLAAAMNRAAKAMGQPPPFPEGRPSKLDVEVLSRTVAYLAGWRELMDPVPSIVGLADVLDVSKVTIWRWAALGKETGAPEDKNRDPVAVEFCNLIERLATKQERELIRGALTEEFNPSSAKLLLTKHGYADKVDASLSNPEGVVPVSGFVAIPVGPARRVDEA